ncbi:hypothetical protein HYT57_03620 [Candidatus Woesearchaeota archaeon]|nr:hypothetical protein [Candidatus Woesearchaeota archaeon]
MEKILQNLGLGQSESKVYLSLLELGPSLAGVITKKAMINRTNCYDALRRLIEKGLVSYIIQSNRKYFRVEPPERLLNIVKEEKACIEKKEKEIREIIPSLIKKIRSPVESPAAYVYAGKKGVKSIFEDILIHNEYLVFGSSGKFKDTLGIYFKQFQKKIKINKVRCRLIASETIKNTDIVEHAETRYLPKEYMTLISTIIYGEKVAIISWGDMSVGFLLEDKQIVDSYKKYFEFVWKMAKK